MNGHVSSGSQPHPPRRPIFQSLLISGVLASVLFAASPGSSEPALAQESAKKPNILFIMGDDVGWFNIGAYHRGMMSGKTPNLDKLAAEGMISPTITPRRAARRAGQTSSPASCRSVRVLPPSARRAPMSGYRTRR